MASADVHEDVKCSICLTIYTDPATLTCGHNFCRDCIETYLDTKERHGKDFRCPHCRTRFRRRPELHKNTDLSNIAEKVKSSAGQENRKCSESDHNRILELYCTKDGTCICMLCMVEGEHQGHKVETLEKASEKKKKKKKLRDDLSILKLQREKTEKRVQKLKHRREMVKKHREDIKGKFTSLLRSIRIRLDSLDKQIGSEISKEEEQENPVFDLIQNLELEKNKLSRKIEHIEELNTADPITLLQDQESDTKEDTGLGWEGTPEEFLISWRSRMLLSMMIHVGLSDIIKMKDIYLPGQKPASIILDINTAAENVQIFHDWKTAVSTDVKQIRPNTAERFESSQVLSANTFSSGQHYWVVETSTSGELAVGMGYSSMRRGGWIGENDKFWGIGRAGDSYQILHNGESKPLSHTISSNRLLVYLDYEGKCLSFCELSDTLNLLHTFTTTFTEPLHAVLQLKKNMTNNSHSHIRVF